MKSTKGRMGILGLVLWVCGGAGGCVSTTTNDSGGAHAEASQATRPGAPVMNVRTFGATGGGTQLDTPAINKTIETANASGGGTVFFPAGTYLCYSIHLKSNVALYLDQGATILAADNPMDEGVAGYDPPESNDFDPYEDFGHSHWHNSLIWGENLENISILGPGRIDGKGLTSGRNPRAQRNPPPQMRDGEDATETTRPAARGSRRDRSGATSRPRVEPPAANRATTKFGYPGGDTLPPGIGNKAIALKRCRNVIFKDFTIYRGGHFGILATGVDNWTLEGVRIDTNRDGVDIDCCRNVRMSNCSVNSPNDDGICPKSDYSLGEPRPCENITITNCSVSGYAMGSMLDGTYKERPNGPGTGRIKFGTESNGGFKNITISNCTFSYCRGLALETVDGALLEDVAINNITMRDIGNSPIFMRLGSRLRGPEDTTKVGTLRRVIISNVVCWNAPAKLSSIISGIPGSNIEDVTIQDVRIYAKGGGTREQATSQPAEKENAYPEPGMFGDMPAYGFFVRHVNGLKLRNVEMHLQSDDARPAVVLEDVKGADLFDFRAQKTGDVPTVRLRDVQGFTARQCPDIPDTKLDRVDEKSL